MLENILIQKNCSVKTKITVKSLVSAGLVALAVLLPQVVHLAAGQAGGTKWLPMYLPVLLAGCLLGVRWGLLVGIASPVVSFAVTSAFGNAMPAAFRLPYMIAELAVFACVTGAFSAAISKNSLTAFPAVILAQLCGRAVFVLSALVFQSVSPVTAAAAVSQVSAGLVGLIAQAVIAPLAVILLGCLLKGDKK